MESLLSALGGLAMIAAVLVALLIDCDAGEVRARIPQHTKMRAGCKVLRKPTVREELADKPLLRLKDAARKAMRC